MRPGQRDDSYLGALRFALSGQANAYGFTLITWGSGALAIWKLGKPDPADVFAFIGGGLVSICVLVAVVIGVWRPFRSGAKRRRPFSAMHLLSVPAGVAAGWAMTYLGGGPAGFFLTSLAAVAVYELLLGEEVVVALPSTDDAAGSSGE